MKIFTAVLTAVFGLLLWSDLAKAATPQEIYTGKCAVCHGAKGEGKAALGTKPFAAGDPVVIITDGKPPKMPAYKDKLTADEIKGLADFLKTLK